MKWIAQIQKKKQLKEKLSMITCYDAASAKLVAQTPIDMLLVGDSIAMTVYGYDSTIHATVEMMVRHTEAVRRGAPEKFIVSDMPFGSFRQGAAHALQVATELMRVGANAVKVEGLAGHQEVIQHLVQSGIPVMGHLGLTPQTVHQLGGYRVQGKTELAQAQIVEAAKELESLGCFALVLECVPSILAAKVQAHMDIPVIGIGAGVEVDGQVLVMHDILGLDQNFSPKLAKQYINLSELIKTAIQDYVFEVQAGHFPTQAHCYD